MRFDRVIAVRNDKTVFRDGDRCIKVFNHEYSKADVLKEALSHARIEETDLNLPELYQIVRIEDNWAIVFDYIKGKTLQEYMDADGEAQGAYMHLFADIQHRVHARKHARLPKVKDVIQRKIEQSSLDHGLKKALFHSLEQQTEGDALCHGNFEPSNVILSADDEAYILDWPHAAQGDAAVDAATTWLWFMCQDQSERAQQYLTVFCGDDKKLKNSVEGWIPLVAAALYTTGNQHEREVLLACINESSISK